MVAAALAALLVPTPASGGRTAREILPGLMYVREARWAYGGPLVTHVLLGPRPGGLYSLEPILSNGTIVDRETVSAMQRRLSRRATLAGVNGDLFGWETGVPSGMFLRNNVLGSRPFADRSSLGIGANGTLRVGRIGFRARWRVDALRQRTLKRFNRPLGGDTGYALFTRTWGERTPAARRAVEVVVSGVGRASPNVERTGRIVAEESGSGHGIPKRGAVLQARGSARATLREVAAVGRTLTFRLLLDPWWEGVEDAIGGGPRLVEDGAVAFDGTEKFTDFQLYERHPRTAVGQRADGRILLVTVDGRWRKSAGLRMRQLAREMVRLGAVRAMALDGGGSTTMAFDGRVLNRPSDGGERAVSDALMIFYYGVYAPPPRHVSFSPNGDGVADVQTVRAKIVRRSTVDYRLVRPNGDVAWRLQARLGPGTFVKKLESRALAEGRWRWVAEAVDSNGLASRMARAFTVNNTLGFLRLSKRTMYVRRRKGGRIVASFDVTRRARVAASIRKPGGRLVRRLYAGELRAGSYAVVWNGKNANGKVVRTGTYEARVRARNGLGTVKLAKRFRVVRL